MTVKAFIDELKRYPENATLVIREEDFRNTTEDTTIDWTPKIIYTYKDNTVQIVKS